MNFQDRKIWKVQLFLGIFVFLFFCCTKDNLVLPITSFPERHGDFSLWQLDQFYNESQMGYILRTDDGQILVVDGGIEKSSDILDNFLLQLGGTVNTWIVTHPHKDHIGALLGIIKGGNIKIDRIIQSVIDPQWVGVNEYINYNYVLNYNKTIENSGIETLDVSVGDTYSVGNQVELQIIGIRNEEITKNAINNSSLVFKIVSPWKSVLFLGDLGEEGGDKILKNTEVQELHTDYVQMAHHGQAGVKKDFYTAVNAEYALWPTTSWLWENNLDAKGPNSGSWKTLVVRQWMDDLKIKKNYVSGIDGTIQID